MQRWGNVARVVAALTVIVSIAACTNEEAPGPNVSPSATVSPTESPSPSPTSTAVAPTQAVALSAGRQGDFDDDRLVVVSTSTGRVIRTLARPVRTNSNVGPFLPELALSPDRATVYFVRLGPNIGCDNEIMSVPVRGGPERKIVNGSSIAISPDGRYLAYTARGTGPNCHRAPLVVRDLTDGIERRWAWKALNPNDPNPNGGPLDLAWAPDSRHLAFVLNEGDPKWVTYLLDRMTGNDILDAKKVGSQDEGWYGPEFLTNDSLAVIHAVESIHDGDRQRVLDVSTAGRVKAELARRASQMADIALDVSRTFLVYASAGGLYRVQNRTATRLTIGRYEGVAW